MTTRADDDADTALSLRERFAWAASDFEVWSIEPMLDVEPPDADAG